MEREWVMAALAHASSPEQVRAASEHLRRWVEENPDDEQARELLAAAEAGDWETVVAQLGEEASS
jgi:DNA-binding SARP family transcriptional activator